jgi:hypothetical protein
MPHGWDSSVPPQLGFEVVAVVFDRFQMLIRLAPVSTTYAMFPSEETATPRGTLIWLAAVPHVPRLSSSVPAGALAMLSAVSSLASSNTCRSCRPARSAPQPASNTPPVPAA